MSPVNTVTSPMTNSAMTLTSATSLRRLIMRESDDSEVGPDRERKGKPVYPAFGSGRLVRPSAGRALVGIPFRFAVLVELSRGQGSLRRRRVLWHGAVHPRVPH